MSGFDPHVFGESVAALVDAHAGHGGWYESKEGLRCAGDAELVIPGYEWLTE